VKNGNLKLRIWLVKVGEPSPLASGSRNRRTGRLARLLANRGHEVTWWTSAFEHFEKNWIFNEDTEQTTADSINTVFLKGCGYKKNVSVSRFLDHRILSDKWVREASKRVRPDVIVCCLPPHDLANSVVGYAQKLAIPVVVDIRDPWPDIFIDQLPRNLRRFSRILLASEFRLTRKALAGASGIVAVSNALLTWGLQYAGRDRTEHDRVFYLGAGYTETTSVAKSVGNSNKIAALENSLKGKFVVSFYGVFGHTNDVSAVIEAARHLRNTNIAIVLAGSGDFLEKTRQEAHGLANVFIPGWIDDAEIVTLMRISQVGLCTTSKRLELFPNKAFSYLAFGIPMISSYYGDLKDLIEDEKVGVFCAPGDYEALAAAIKLLAENPTLRSNMSQNARKAFREAFNSTHIYENYCNYVEEMAKNESYLRGPSPLVSQKQE
jgi:glycosyltransferase involved in cell wall biosynthesis